MKIRSGLSRIKYSKKDSVLQKKKIIFAVTNDLTHDRRMQRICTALSNAGADVVLIGRELKHSKPFVPVLYKSVRLNCIFHKGPLFYTEYNKRLFLYLLFAKFEVACACDLDTALGVHWACIFKKKIKVYDAHEMFTEVPELTGRAFVKNTWEKIGRLTIPLFNLRYTVGEELAKLMGKKYNVPFDVIRNIAPYEEPANEIIPVDKRNKILLYQGALNVGRGLEACIQAMTSLPDWEFWIAGEGDITEKLKKLSVQLDLQQRVKFLGWVHPDQLGSLLNQARLGINLREKGSLNDFYSLPNKFFDCIHAGLPSINMNYPEYASVNQKYPCSILVDEVSPEVIVSSIQYLDQHPESLMAMTAACHDAAIEFTWEKESAKLVRLYAGL
jgi:glycosyltransferase involved in cell wall biosynthesis